jgi:signal transduction histidine kinase
VRAPDARRTEKGKKALTAVPVNHSPAAAPPTPETARKLWRRFARFASWAGLFRSQAFRIVVIYVVLFGLSATGLIAFTYWNAKRALDAQSDQLIEAEIADLANQYRQLDEEGLELLIMNRSGPGARGLYLLADSGRRVIAGNLDRWPDVAKGSGGFVDFAYERRLSAHQTEERHARGRTFRLTGGDLLLVAQDVNDRYLMVRLFTTTVPWTLALMLLLGLIGGGLISRNMLARLDSINRTSKEIIAGDLSRRVPLSGNQDEFDTLAENLNRMLDRIERLMSGVREVTDSVAHDLRTPLNRLRNRLETTLRHRKRQGVSQSDLEAAVEETDRLIATFNALLLIAEADAGVAREAMAPLDVTSVARDATDLYAPLAEEKGIDLVTSCRSAAWIDGNRSLVSQALVNLVDNAIKYTPAGGRVAISVTEEDDGTNVCVADSGPGIPENEHARVLERFVRLEASRHSPGTGLGLSLVAAVARLHDARLLLEDNRPGLKATLRFRRRLARMRARSRESSSQVT